MHKTVDKQVQVPVGAIVLLAVTQVGLDVSVGMEALTLIGIAVNKTMGLGVLQSN